jgi:hypothetical protein
VGLRRVLGTKWGRRPRLRLHRGPHDIGPRGGCRICRRRSRRIREGIGAFFAAARPRGATMVARVVFAAYVAYLTLPAAPAAPWCLS